MKKTFGIVGLITVLLSLSPGLSWGQKAPLRRADSFFGLHFDFHAGLGDTLIGKSLTEGMVDSLLRAAGLVHKKKEIRTKC
ncbi:MAG: hypothetical protein KKG00_13225 [Bacteroidetes bacterium]|nr:hypothetical protein [Bacteroidota bacterium]